MVLADVWVPSAYTTSVGLGGPIVARTDTADTDGRKTSVPFAGLPAIYPDVVLRGRSESRCLSHYSTKVAAVVKDHIKR